VSLTILAPEMLLKRLGGVTSLVVWLDSVVETCSWALARAAPMASSASTRGRFGLRRMWFTSLYRSSPVPWFIERTSCDWFVLLAAGSAHSATGSRRSTGPVGSCVIPLLLVPGASPAIWTTRRDTGRSPKHVAVPPVARLVRVRPLGLSLLGTCPPCRRSEHLLAARRIVAPRPRARRPARPPYSHRYLIDKDWPSWADCLDAPPGPARACVVPQPSPPTRRGLSQLACG